jgi:hypothetical protein
MSRTEAARRATCATALACACAAARRATCAAALAGACAACGGGGVAQRAAAPAKGLRCARAAPRMRIGAAVVPPAGRLAPRGAEAIRLCRYSGLPRQALVRVADVRRRARVARLVSLLDRLPDMPSPVSCPNDDGSHVVALVAYPRGRVLTLDIGLRGCRAVGNGRATKTAARAPGPQLIALVKRLTAPGHT